MMTIVNKKYIEKCKKALELQQNWVPQKWDIVYVDSKIIMLEDDRSEWHYRHGWGNEIECFKIAGESHDPFVIDKSEAVWLPTYEQLFDMAGIKTLQDFENFIREISLVEQNIWLGISPILKKNDYKIKEVLLAYVMNKLYGKIWSESEGKWVEMENNNGGIQ
ncbi:MAG: hypothetical protein DRP62_01590 [Planctomycetota bacterium]|nr:MAG: hypothetical protein DRP62_01590 [Planctomycetota bacterium]